MDVFTALCAPVNNDHASVPSLKTLALYDFQIGMDGNPNRTPAGSRLKIQITWSCKKKCHTISCTPLLAGCNLYQLKVAIHLDPPDSTLELGYTSFRGVGQDPVGVLAPRDRVNSQKSLLSLETPWGLRRAPIWKGIPEWLKVSGSEESREDNSSLVRVCWWELIFLFLAGSQEKKGHGGFFLLIIFCGRNF